MISRYLKNYQNDKKFESLLSLYNDWNSKINISSIRDEKGVVIKHFLDSLLGNEIQDFSGKRVLDVGTGGGFPILPLAIVNKDADFVGLDSVKKKLMVIGDISKKLGLKNITLIHGRAEDFGQDPKFREKFDIVTVRAFAKFSSMLEMALPFLKKGGLLLAYQTSSIFDEIDNSKKVLKLLGGELLDIVHFDLPEDFGKRDIVLIEKINKTPPKYPRKVGIPKDNPL